MKVEIKKKEQDTIPNFTTEDCPLLIEGKNGLVVLFVTPTKGLVLKSGNTRFSIGHFGEFMLIRGDKMCQDSFTLSND